MTLSNVFNVLLVVLAIAAVLLAILYFVGKKLEKRQVEQQSLLDAAKQTVSILVIDKKKLKLKEAGLPKMVYEQTPKYMRWAKVPVVKAKIGPKIMTLMADEKVFAMLPVKTEAKVVISGIYITDIKNIRGGSVVPLKKKKGFFARFKKDTTHKRTTPKIHPRNITAPKAKTQKRKIKNQNNLKNPAARGAIPPQAAGFSHGLSQPQLCLPPGTYIHGKAAV